MVNPMAAKYDLIVIGAGPAGEKGAAQAAYFGKRVCLVDPCPRPGGIAVTTAGIPTKTVREGAVYLSGLGQGAVARSPIGTQDPWSLLMTRNHEVSRLMTTVVERNLVRHGIERIQGRARLLSAGQVEVDKGGGDRIVVEAGVVLVACGSLPRPLPNVPMDDPDVHDSENILEIERAPESLLVIGSGAAGCEYASIFAALGTQVTIVGGTHLLPAVDAEMAGVLGECFNSMGIRVIPMSNVSAVVRSGGALEAKLTDGHTVRVQKVLVAAGRCPQTTGLGLEQVGVKFNSAGWVCVDNNFATNVPGIVAAGDVIGPPSLASVSMEQARVAICHAFGFEYKTHTDRFWPIYIFSIPEVASVGLTEEQARAAGIVYEVGRASFGTNAKARISGFPDGLVKLVFRASDKGLLGVHIVGELASELIHIGQFVMHVGGTIDRFIDATFAVPTRSEAYKYAAYDGLDRSPGVPSGRAIGSPPKPPIGRPCQSAYAMAEGVMGNQTRRNAVGLGPKLVGAEQALTAIPPGSRIYLGTGCAAPRHLLATLETMRSGPPDLEFVSFVTTSAVPEEAGVPRTRYRHRTFFVGSDVRGLAGSGQLDYVPISLEDVPQLLASGKLPIDVALLQVSPPDGRGFVSLGVSVDLAPAVLRVARRVIAEVNPSMPRTHGESFVHLDRFDAFVNVDTPVTEYRHPLADEIGERVARYIAAIIDDGSTLQIGLGRVPNEALRHLKDRRDLGIHSDVITDGVVDLVEAGVVTNRRKTRHPDRIIASYCLGTRRLYDFVDDNPRLAFLPIEQVCDPQEVAANARMVSITQAFAVDLTGQVCVDQFAGEFYGGVSTQAGFIRGAARSPGGKPIICLASNTDDGASRIKPLLETGDGVGIARSDVHYVVTEYGIAYLFGKSIRERALALIDVAHPNCREELLEAAKRLGYVLPEQYLASQAAYPVHEERTVQLKNGATVLIRPAHASDADALRAQFHHLTQDQVYTRFFRRVRSLSYAELQTLCNVNHETEVAFLAVTGPRESEVVVGSACYFLNSTTNLAEIAFMVASEWQGQGLGTALQARLQEYAIGRGVRGFVAEMLPRNARMLRLARHARGTITTSSDEDSVHVTILFQNNARDADVAASENTRPSVA